MATRSPDKTSASVSVRTETRPRNVSAVISSDIYQRHLAPAACPSVSGELYHPAFLLPRRPPAPIHPLRRPPPAGPRSGGGGGGGVLQMCEMILDGGRAATDGEKEGIARPLWCRGTYTNVHVD